MSKQLSAEEKVKGVGCILLLPFIVWLFLWDPCEGASDQKDEPKKRVDRGDAAVIGVDSAVGCTTKKQLDRAVEAAVQDRDPRRVGGCIPLDKGHKVKVLDVGGSLGTMIRVQLEENGSRYWVLEELLEPR